MSSKKLVSFVALFSFVLTTLSPNYLLAFLKDIRCSTLRPPNGITQIKKDNLESLKRFEVDGEGTKKVLENNLLLIEKMDSFNDYLPQLIPIFVLVQKSGSASLSEYKMWCSGEKNSLEKTQKNLAALQMAGLVKIINDQIFITKKAISLILNWQADVVFKRLNPTEKDKIIYLVQNLGEKNWLTETQLRKYLGLVSAKELASFLEKGIFSVQRIQINRKYKIRNKELLCRIVYEDIKGTPKEIKAMINKIQKLTYSELWSLFYIYLASENYDLDVLKQKMGRHSRVTAMRKLAEIGLIHEGKYGPPIPSSRYINWLSSFPGKTPDEKLKSFREKHPLINTSATTSNEKKLLGSEKAFSEEIFSANKELIDDLINLKMLADGGALNLSSIARLSIRGLITAEAGKIAISPLGRNILGEEKAKAPIVTKYPFPAETALNDELKDLVEYKKNLNKAEERFFKNYHKNRTSTAQNIEKAGHETVPTGLAVLLVLFFTLPLAGVITNVSSYYHHGLGDLRYTKITDLTGYHLRPVSKHFKFLKPAWQAI